MEKRPEKRGDAARAWAQRAQAGAPETAQARKALVALRDAAVKLAKLTSVHVAADYLDAIASGLRDGHGRAVPRKRGRPKDAGKPMFEAMMRRRIMREYRDMGRGVKGAGITRLARELIGDRHAVLGTKVRYLQRIRDTPVPPSTWTNALTAFGADAARKREHDTK